jgi:3,4-dihydroxy-2-butanone 4-phosphate synthase
LQINTEPLIEFGQTYHERVNNAMRALCSGRPVVLIDDENRENEGDLIVAAEKVTAVSMNFLIRHGSGIVCLALTPEQTDRLELAPMVSEGSNRSQFVAAFTVSIEASEGVTTGVSAADRAKTIQVAVADDAKPGDLARPGHMFPVRAQEGGVLTRPGHTEGSVDLARLAGLKPAAAICELMNSDGTMSRLPEIIQFARQHDLIVLSISDIIFFRKNQVGSISNEYRISA